MRSWPPAAVPRGYVGVFSGPAELPVASQGEEVVALVIDVAGRLVGVRPSPGIERYRLPQIGPTPVPGLRVAAGSLAQCRETLRSSRIEVVIEAILIERQREQLDLRSSSRHLRIADVAEHHRAHEAGENRDHGDHHEEFYQGKPHARRTTHDARPFSVR